MEGPALSSLEFLFSAIIAGMPCSVKFKISGNNCGIRGQELEGMVAACISGKP